jgi:flagellar hook-length control protein FliK
MIDAALAETANAGTAGHDDTAGQEPSRRQARAATGQAAPAGAALSADTLVPAMSPQGAQPAHTQTAGAAWKAAAAAARSDDAAPRTADLPRASAPAASPVVTAPFEPALLRDLAVRAPEVAPAMPGETAAPEPVHAQIVKSIRMQWAGGAGEARVSLKPEYLGEVVASIKVEAGVVTATLQADTAEVRRLLEAQTTSLREALSEHGLKLDRLVIAEPDTPAGPSGDRRSRGRQPQPPPSRPRRRQAPDERTFDLNTE